MTQFTPAQAKAIETWTEKRDALLREIGIYESRLQVVKKDCIEGGLALDDLNKQIAEARGRLAELDALEERHKSSISVAVAELEVRKTRLETECTAMEKRLKDGAESEAQIATSIKILGEAHDKMSDQAQIVNRVVGEIIQTSQLHTSEMKTIMDSIRTVSTEVIDKGKKNIEQTNIVLGELPRFIFELQRPIPVRRFAEVRTKEGVNRSKVDEIATENNSLKT